MARQLWLLRHADAEPHGTRADFDRRLTAKGEQQARAAGLALVRLGVSFDAVLSSPKVRARETAELAVARWPKDERPRMSVHAPLAEGFYAEQALAAAQEGEHTLLVGHEPDLSTVVAQLTGGRIDLKKAGLAVVRLEGAGGELLVLMRPRELALIAGIPSGG